MVEGIQKVLNEGLSLTTQDLLSKPVEQLTLEEAVTVQSVLDVIVKKIGSRDKDIKKLLETKAREIGQDDPDGKGHKIIKLADGEVTLQKKVASNPDVDGLKVLLEESKIPLKDCFDEVKVMEFNPKKLDFLLSAKKLDAEKVKALKKVSYAVLVKKPQAVTKLLGEGK